MFAGYFKMAADKIEQENCVAHNGRLIPVPGCDIMVRAWYQGTPRREAVVPGRLLAGLLG